MEKDQTKLKKFLNFEFSSKEERTFKDSNEYSEFKRIIELFDDVKTVDYNQERALEELDKTRLVPKKNRGKVVPLYKKWVPMSVAASILLLISFFYLNSGKNDLEHSTLAGEFKQIELPDASKAWLNAKSEIAYNEVWKNSREINLEGEAYFEVAKGKTFTVNTSQGTVTVLGTKFNVKQRGTIFEVFCFEGRVSVLHKGQETILTANNRFSSKTLEKSVVEGNLVSLKPFWMDKISVFENTPINQVILDLSIQYDVNIVMEENLNKNLSYTGRYSYEDSLETVLEVLCESLSMKYVRNGRSIYLKKG